MLGVRSAGLTGLAGCASVLGPLGAAADHSTTLRRFCSATLDARRKRLIYIRLVWGFVNLSGLPGGGPLAQRRQSASRAGCRSRDRRARVGCKYCEVGGLSDHPVGGGTGCAAALARRSRPGTPRCRECLGRRQILKKPVSSVRRVRLSDVKSGLAFREARFG